MNLAKPTEVPQPDSRQEYSPISTQAILFAVLQDFVSTTKSTAGYIDIISDNPHDTLAIKRLGLVNKQQANSTGLIDVFYRLSSLGAAHPKSMPIEKLFTYIAANSSIRIAASSSGHSSALVSTDEDVLSWCIIAIVCACSTSKVLKYRSRKRGKYLVLSIYSRKKTWLTPRLVDLIRGFKPTHLSSKKQRLDELLVTYALVLLSQIDVKLTAKKTLEQEGLYLHLPVSQQLNVFEASEYLG
ncbi:MAG: hypothetical protein WCK87_02670 [Candidatus Saccharibacteria bacterium]